MDDWYYLSKRKGKIQKCKFVVKNPNSDYAHEVPYDVLDNGELKEITEELYTKDFFESYNECLNYHVEKYKKSIM